MIEAYPLQWPQGFKRFLYPSRSRFKVPSFAIARDGLLRELDLLRATNVVLSTNIPLRKDGLPYANHAQPKDRGVAVYFKLRGAPRSLACDQWDRIEDNVHALQLTVNAMRGLDRWGASDMLERAFTGFAALPAPETKKSWREILGIVNVWPSPEEVRAARNRLSKIYHPDMGSLPDSSKMSEVNQAFEEAQRYLSETR